MNQPTEESAFKKTCVAAVWGVCIALLVPYALAELTALTIGGLSVFGVPGDPPGLKAAWRNLLIVTFCMLIYGPIFLVLGAAAGSAAFWCFPSNWRGRISRRRVAGGTGIDFARWGFPILTVVFLGIMLLILIVSPFVA